VTSLASAPSKLFSSFAAAAHHSWGEDEEVPVAQALAFAAKLSGLHKPYELAVYAKDIHEAANNRRDRDTRIVAWFKRFLR
jgi:dipeptidyl aminopeptidase/acylaminoacyl peptidase